MSELFTELESNDKDVAENAKRKLHEQLQLVRESWLVTGLYEYYLRTNSTRTMEIFVTLNEPHYKYLFERLSDSVRRSETEHKVKSLTLLGHIVRSQPTWIYKIHEHQLLKDIFNLLKCEEDILPLLSALLLLIVLIPMIPSLMGEFLHEVFEIFSRLASWNCSGSDIMEEQMVHLQMSLYALFQRLYGMYPCNFLAYLRIHYRDKNKPVFIHTIKPMLDTVKMHPSLVTASKDNETTAERWKTMGVHDVIVECERLTLDVNEKCSHDCGCYFNSGFRSRSGTTNSVVEPKFHLENLKNLKNMCSEEREYFTPSICFQAKTPPILEATVPSNIPHPHILNASQKSQEGTSPPEAAIEATPETTPVRDLYTTPIRSPHLNSNVVRGLSSFGSKNRSTGSSNTTPTHSQPSSPMRKDMSPFNFSADTKHVSAFRASHAHLKIQRMVQERSQANEIHNEAPSQSIAIQNQFPIIKSIALEGGLSSIVHRNESPVSKEDEEVLSIVGHKEGFSQLWRQCDSVIHDSQDKDVEDATDEQEHGSPCTAGGLHMPNSRSINDFAKKMQRLRYHSQCNPEIEHIETSTGSSPGNCSQFLSSSIVRRANSCPEIKKSPIGPTKEVFPKPLREAEEENNLDDLIDEQLDGVDHIELISTETQTENFFPMPYEHLFLNIFPTLGSTEQRISPSSSPAPLKTSVDKESTFSTFDILDRFIETASRNDMAHMKIQLQLLYHQLLFERYRRDTHAYRNRRILADAKNARVLDEYNSALRDQVQLQQKEIDDLKEHLDILRRDKVECEKRTYENIQFWERKCKELQNNHGILEIKHNTLRKELDDCKDKYSAIDQQRQNAEASLLDALAEINVAREQALTGQKGRDELEHLNREILLFGELQMRYQEKLNELASTRKYEEEIETFSTAYKEQLKGLQHQLDSKLAHLDACRTRITELESIIVQKDETISSQKKSFILVNEENYEKIKAVESKYQTQIAINKTYEEKILELWQKNEPTRNVHSPATSSCHEAGATDRGAGLSPHSSPLSVSLASSEGSAAFISPDMKNLQMIAERKLSKPTEELELPGESENLPKSDNLGDHD